MADNKEITKHWGAFSFTENVVYKCSLGSLQLYTKHDTMRWYIANKRDIEEISVEPFAVCTNVPEDLEWKIFVGETPKLVVSPAMADRPVVIKPEQATKIMPKSTLTTYLHLPVWVQLYMGEEKKEQLLLELPLVELTSTWFGASIAGELAYGSKANMLNDVNLEKLEAWNTVVPVRIVNESQSVLDFQRLCLRVPHCTLYQIADAKLSSNLVSIVFKGLTQTSHLDFSNNKPAFGQSPVEIGLVRVPFSNNLIDRSFYFIKSVTQM